MNNKKHLALLAICIMASKAYANEKEDVMVLRNTTINLISELVNQGILTDKAAKDMIQRAEKDAQQEAKEEMGKLSNQPPTPGEVRVPYVPQFVKDEIRQQVRSELREEVVGDVMQKAKNEKWGMPEALPEWINRFKLSGDIRLRSQHEFMGSDNVNNYYSDFQAINDAGGVSAAGQNAFLNTRKDRHRFRERVRLGIDAKITDSLKAGIRLASGNMPDPVSTNQSLGNTGSQFQFNIDRAYLKYDATNDEGFKWLTLSGGRIANPWYVGGGEFTGGSELIWDTDLSFEGFSGTYRYRLGGSGSLLEKNDDSHSLFATAGAFPLQESGLKSDGKWLFGGQVGVDWGFNNQDKLKVAVGYFDYVDIQAKPNRNNPPTCATNNPESTDSTPQFLQFGNSMAVICNENASPNSLPGRYGLASDYNIFNVFASYDLARFAPHHLILSADFAKNIGFDRQDVNSLARADIKDETNAWQLRLDFGWPKVDKWGKWNVFAMYKYVERDAVLDAFSDSDFHLGGTNAQGWVIGGNYGLMKNVWLTSRWLSADMISGPKYGVDILQLDINTRF